MKGKIYSWETIKKGKRYGIYWYHAPHKKTYPIRHFEGRDMWHRRDAEHLLTVMREEYRRGVFRIEKYIQIRSGYGLYLDEWLDIIKPNIEPSTYRNYKSMIKCHIKPWFDERKIGLHEIDYMLLLQFVNDLKLQGSTKSKALRIIRSSLSFYRKVNPTFVMPVPVEQSKLGIVKKPVEYIPEARQLTIIDKADPQHRPIFHWLRLHLRRPGEARALLKEDFDGEVFTIRRTWSGGVLRDNTKTDTWFETPMSDLFRPHYEWLKKQEWWLRSRFFFPYRQGSKVRHYASSTLEYLWNRAAKECGESINLYRGLVSSSITIMCNMGIPIQEIALASGKSVKTIMKYYLHASIAKKKEVLDRRVTKLNRITKQN